MSKQTKVKIRKAWRAFKEFNQGLANGAAYALNH